MIYLNCIQEMDDKMPSNTQVDNLTPALEDYLESIWEILQIKKVAQVTEIAKLRGVNVTSVTPAMRRLSKMGLVDYTARAYVDLTQEGIDIARKIKARHDILERFLVDILGVSQEIASEDACSAEHMFSDETIDQIVRFFEYVQRCGSKEKEFIKRFHGCSVVHPEKKNAGCNCTAKERKKRSQQFGATKYLSKMKSGEIATISQLVAKPDIRKSLIDRGFVSGRQIELVDVSMSGKKYTIKLGSDEIALSLNEAKCVVVVA